MSNAMATKGNSLSLGTTTGARITIRSHMPRAPIQGSPLLHIMRVLDLHFSRGYGKWLTPDIS